MNKDEQKLMSLYGITQTSKSVYAYKHYKYDNLKDAIIFAEIDRKRPPGNSPAVPEWIVVDSIKQEIPLQ